MGRYSQILKNICRMLDIEYTDLLVIECPICGEESLEIKSDNPVAKCECGLEWRLEGKFDCDKRKLAYLMTEKKGVDM